MRLIKKSRWIRTFLAAILIISLAGQSLTAYAGYPEGTDGSSANSQDTDDTYANNLGSDGYYNGYGWIVSIQKVDNTATDADSDYAESKVSFANAWLHDFPSCYYSTDGNSLWKNPEKYAFILQADSTNTASKYRVYNPTTTSTTDKLVPCYKSSSGSSTFEASAQLLENSGHYDEILTGLKNYSLTSADIISWAGDTTAAIKGFTGLWKNSGTAADRMNEFVLSDSLDHWQQCVRYLDLLIIVNAMCGNAWSSGSTDYIQLYLDNLNQDGSEEFVAIVFAAAINSRSIKSNSGLMTLPVYYNQKTNKGLSTFTHWDGSGNWDEVQSKFNSYTGTAKFGMNSSTDAVWWGSANMATSVNPTGLDDTTNGFCGYTYIAPTISFEPEEIISPPSSSSSPSSSVAATDIVTPTFTVEVTTEDEYMQRDKTQPVTATVTIDMGQTDAVQKTFKSIYTSLKNSDESYKTAIEVFVERTFSDGSGVDTSNAVMDSDASGGYFASAVQPTLTSAVVYRWQGTDWDSGINSSVTALPTSPPANPRTTTPPSRQTERSSVSPSQGRQKL